MPIARRPGFVAGRERHVRPAGQVSLPPVVTQPPSPARRRGARGRTGSSEAAAEPPRAGAVTCACAVWTNGHKHGVDHGDAGQREIETGPDRADRGAQEAPPTIPPAATDSNPVRAIWHALSHLHSNLFLHTRTCQA